MFAASVGQRKQLVMTPSYSYERDSCMLLFILMQKTVPLISSSFTCSCKVQTAILEYINSKRYVEVFCDTYVSICKGTTVRGLYSESTEFGHWKP